MPAQNNSILPKPAEITASFRIKQLLDSIKYTDASKSKERTPYERTRFLLSRGFAKQYKDIKKLWGKNPEFKDAIGLLDSINAVRKDYVQERWRSRLPKLLFVLVAAGVMVDISLTGGLTTIVSTGVAYIAPVIASKIAVAFGPLLSNVVSGVIVAGLAYIAPIVIAKLPDIVNSVVQKISIFFGKMIYQEDKAGVANRVSSLYAKIGAPHDDKLQESLKAGWLLNTKRDTRIGEILGQCCIKIEDLIKEKQTPVVDNVPVKNNYLGHKPPMLASIKNTNDDDKVGFIASIKKNIFGG